MLEALRHYRDLLSLDHGVVIPHVRRDFRDADGHELGAWLHAALASYEERTLDPAKEHQLREEGVVLPRLQEPIDIQPKSRHARTPTSGEECLILIAAWVRIHGRGVPVPPSLVLRGREVGEWVYEQVAAYRDGRLSEDSWQVRELRKLYLLE